jgi:DNA polymerase-3 subunit delta'
VEIEELDERARQLGERGGGRTKVTERHKRELRRFRTDELRSGLRVLSLVYREAIAGLGADAAPHEVIAYSDAVHAIRLVSESLRRNANERLQLETLLMNLPSLRRN